MAGSWVGVECVARSVWLRVAGSNCVSAGDWGLGTGAGDGEAAACNGLGCTHAAADAGSPREPEFTDPLRRRTLQGDEEGLLGDQVGLSEDDMVEQEAQDAAAMAALADLPRATQGLQLYDRCACRQCGWCSIRGWLGE